MKTAEGQFAPSLRPWVGGPDRAWPVGGRVWDRAFRQHQLPSGNTAGGVKSNEVRFHLSLLGGVGDVAQGLQTHQVQARDSVVGVSGFEAREGVLSDDEGAGAEGDEAGIEGVDVDVGCEGVVGTAQRFCASHHRPKPPQRGSAPHPHSENGLPAENLRSAEVQEQPFLKVLRGWALRSSTLTPSGRSLKDDVGSVPAPGWLRLLSAACLRRPRCPSWGDEHPRRTLPPLRSLQFSL